MMPTKQRLDQIIHQRGLAVSREKARAMIMAGEVQVNGQIMDKPGTQVDVKAEVTVQSKPRFVSRGGDKLAWALDTFIIPHPGVFAPMWVPVPAASPTACCKMAQPVSLRLMWATANWPTACGKTRVSSC